MSAAMNTAPLEQFLTYVTWQWEVRHMSSGDDACLKIKQLHVLARRLLPQ